MHRSMDAPVIWISTAVYDLLLFLYPARFQREYGPHMTQVFRDCCLRAFNQNGGIGMLELWVLTLFDLARSVVEVHTQKETGMTNSNFIRLSGWALMLTAVIFVVFFVFAYLEETSGVPSGPLQSLYSGADFAVVAASPVLLAVGLLGLRSRYGDSAGGFGKQVLLVGMVAGLALSLALILVGIAGEVFFTRAWAWFAQFAGPGVSMACLALFGIPALSRRPLPRWNGLPLLAGIFYPLLILLYALIEIEIALTGDSPKPGGIATYATIMTIQCIALLMLGYVLQGDSAKGSASPLPGASVQ